jgi:TrmH family RNA methyltransferase
MKYPPLEQNWTEESPTEGLEVLAGLGEPSNLGALIRNCEAFGASLVLLKECAFPFHPKVIRASSGSVFRVKITQGPSILDLKENLIALDKEGLNIKDFAWPQNARLLVGEEGRGIPEGLKSSTNIQIPMSGRVESLNAVAATSIALFHYRLRHPLK